MQMQAPHKTTAAAFLGVGQIVCVHCGKRLTRRHAWSTRSDVLYFDMQDNKAKARGPWVARRGSTHLSTHVAPTVQCVRSSRQSSAVDGSASALDTHLSVTQRMPCTNARLLPARARPAAGRMRPTCCAHCTHRGHYTHHKQGCSSHVLRPHSLPKALDTCAATAQRVRYNTHTTDAARTNREHTPTPLLLSIPVFPPPASPPVVSGPVKPSALHNATPVQVATPPGLHSNQGARGKNHHLHSWHAQQVLTLCIRPGPQPAGAPS